MKPEDRTARILRIAGESFLRSGYARTSMDAIARDARVSKRDIYCLWPNKAAIFSAVVAGIYASAEQGWDADTTTRSTRDRLVTLARRNLDSFLTDPQLGLLRASISSVRHAPEIAAQIHRGRITSWTGFNAHFLQMAQEGQLAGINPLMAAIRFGSMNVEGVRHLLAPVALSAAERQQLAQRTTDIFLHGALGAGTTGQEAPQTEPPATNAEEIYPAPRIAGKTAMRLSQERFDTLMAETLSEFCKAGFSDFKAASIARSTGISTATIYRHFTNKDALFRHAVQLRISANSREKPELPTLPDTAEAALAMVARILLDRHLMPERLGLQRLLVEEAPSFPDLARAFYATELGITSQALRQWGQRFLKERWPFDPIAIRVFHALATFGTRFILTPDAVPDSERDALSATAARIFLRGLAE